MDTPQATMPISERLDLCYQEPGDPHPGLTAARKMKVAAAIVGKLNDDDLGRLLAIMGVVPCPSKEAKVEQVLILLGGDIHSLRSHGTELALFQSRSAETTHDPAGEPLANVYRYLIRARAVGSNNPPIVVGPPIADIEQAMQDANALPENWSEVYVVEQDESGRIVREVKVRG